MRSNVRNAVIAALVIALIVGFVFVGPLLNAVPVGLDSSAFLFGDAIQAVVRVFAPDLTNAAAGGVWLLLWILGIGVVAFLLVRAAVRSKVARVDPARRRFLTGAGSGAGVALGSMAVGAVAGSTRYLGLGREDSPGWNRVIPEIFGESQRTHPEWKDAWKGSRIRAHRRFGRTGWEVSDIVLGTGRITREGGERIAREAIDRGVNYFDTSPDYAGAGSENVMGRAIAGLRDQLFIATKFCTPMGHLPPGTPVAKYIEAVEGSLGRLGTDYVDLCHVHSVDSVERLMDENVHEAFDRLKQQGKVRFMGFSTHTPNLVEVANAGIDSGRFDVMMLAYHHGLWSPLAEIIERGRREQDMGVVAMKTLKGAKHRGLENFQAYADSFSQASLKWALANPNVSCAVISFFELQHVDEYLFASGRVLEESDISILEEYDRQIAGTYCGPHCGACLGSCSEGLAIHDVLRHRMYFEDYGWEKEAMRLYARLEKNASVCVGCSAPCAGSCPVGIPIQERALGAHELLTLG
jgi:aryl-alcohol dehydrogenase-like predicted oxidoreductase